MKTFTSIDLFVQALLIFSLLGTGAATIFNETYMLFFLFSLLLTGIWQLGSAIVGSFFHQDKYKPVYLAASIIYCSFLVFMSRIQFHYTAFGVQNTEVAQITFVVLIPFFAALIYFYICVVTYEQYSKAKKEAEFV